MQSVQSAVLPSLRIVGIGAGVSGLIAARTLSDHGHEVQIFEKARIPGGRMSSRRTDSYAFDHGAQYFTATDKRFRTVVDSWLQAGIVNLWNGRIRIVRNGEIRTEKICINVTWGFPTDIGCPSPVGFSGHPLAHPRATRYQGRSSRITDG